MTQSTGEAAGTIPPLVLASGIGAGLVPTVLTGGIGAGQVPALALSVGAGFGIAENVAITGGQFDFSDANNSGLVVLLFGGFSG